jgi:hypothetical protein
VQTTIPGQPAMADREVIATGGFVQPGAADILWRDAGTGAMTEWTFGLNAGDFLIV